MNTTSHTKRVLLFFTQNPYPGKTGTHRRCLTVINALQQLGCRVTFFSHAEYGPYRWDQESLGYFYNKDVDITLYKSNDNDKLFSAYAYEQNPDLLNLAYHCPPGLTSQFRDVYNTLKPDIVLVFYAYSSGLLSAIDTSSCITVMDSIDLVSLSSMMQLVLGAHLGEPPYDALHINPAISNESFFVRFNLPVNPEEFSLYDLYDFTLSVSQHEAAIIAAHTSKTTSEYLPITFPVPSIQNSYAGDPVFVAADNPFNAQAYLYLASRVMPLILQEASPLEVMVVGEITQKLVPSRGMVFRGFVPDLKELYAGACCAVCPIIGGTGMSVKVIEAMAHGVPVVVLRNSSQESPVRHGIDGFIADNANEFARYVKLLYNDRGLCARMGAAAREAVVQNFSDDVVMRKLGEIVNSRENKRLSITAELVWRASVFNYSGYATLSRYTLLALITKGVPVQLVPLANDEKFIDLMVKYTPEQLKTWQQLLVRNVTNGVHVIFHPPTTWQGQNLYSEWLGEQKGDFSHVGITMFETDRLPHGWAEACNIMDEIWVPSTFNLSTFKRAGVRPELLQVIPFGLDAERCDPVRIAPLPITGQSGFTFLSVFQWNLRKGWDILLRAYLQAFSVNDDVCLTIRAYPDAVKLPAIRERVRNYVIELGYDPEHIPHIIVIDDFISDEQMPGLYRSADCFVLPTRGEGWGIPYMEAMASGLPTIATNWSSHLDFMNERNSYLIRIDGMENVPLEQMQENPFYTPDQQWAAPSVEHTAQLMRHVFENREEARAVGAIARQDICEKWTLERTADWIHERIKVLEARAHSEKNVENVLELSSLPSLPSSAPPDSRNFGSQNESSITIGIDARTFQYPDSMARGVGQYSFYHLYNVIKRLPTVTFFLYLETLDTPDSLHPLTELANAQFCTVEDYNPSLVDLIHICDPMNDSSGFDSPLRLFKHEKTTVTFYDLGPVRYYFDEWKDLYKKTYLKRLSQLFHSNCHLLAISEFTKEDLIAYSTIPEERVTTISAGLNSPVSSPAPLDSCTNVKKKFGITKPYFLHIGAHDTHKNFIVALQAFIECRKQHDIQFVVVGKMSDAIEFTRLLIAERKIDDVIFTDFVTRVELNALYSGAIATLFLSSFEGFGLPVLEAFANQCPVITTNVTSIPEVSGDAAILCDPLDVGQVVDGMMRLLADQSLGLELRQRGLRQAQKFTWEKVADRTIMVWEQILGRKLQAELSVKTASVEPDYRHYNLSSCATTKQCRISWIGGLFANTSLAHVNRELCLQLLNKGYAISFNPTEPDDFSQFSDPRFKRLEAIRNLPLDVATITIRHQWPPDFTPPVSGKLIMIQPWEFGSIPKEWLMPIQKQVDEVWAYTSYVRDCYLESGVAPEKVHIVPLGVDTTTFTPDTTPLLLNTTKRFRFLFVGGTIHRKGIDLLLGAYHRTFTATDDVCLVIKDMGGTTVYQGQTAGEVVRHFQQDPSAPEIEYIDRTLTSVEMAGLYTACHCLVHPYRGEGFGLPIAEAMACGLAPIVTGYGAALDFCSHENAWLIPATAEKLPLKQIGNRETVDYPLFAEPDFDALCDLMRYAWQHPAEVTTRGKIACCHIREHFTWEQASQKVEERIRALTVQADAEAVPSRSESDEDTALRKLLVEEACSKAQMQSQRGDIDVAVQTLLNQGIKADPTSPVPFIQLAEILLASGRHDEALQVLPEMPPTTDPELIFEIEAICFAALGDNKAARMAANKALERPRVLVVRGTLAARGGDLEQAETLFRLASDRDPSCGVAWLSLGMLLWGNGDMEGAYQAVRQAVVVDPLNGEAVKILRDMAERLG